MEVRKEMPMSKSGFSRLSKKDAIIFRKRVFKRIFSGNVNTYYIEDERKLAKWLYIRFGDGLYVLFTWRFNRETKMIGYSKMLCKVKVSSVSSGVFDYDIIESRGISRYSFWIGKPD